MKEYNSGIYKLKTIINSELIWHKDSSPAIPFKYEHSQHVFNQLDKIVLAEPTNLKPNLIFLMALYKEDNKFNADFGYWELLIILILLSMLAEKIEDTATKELIINEYLTLNNHNRIYWKHVDDFYQNELLKLNLFDFCKRSDDKLSDVEKVLREVVESVWEYTNCIKIDSDQEIMDLINKIVEFSHVMVILGENPDQSLSVAANMYGSFKKLVETDIKSLSSEWNFF